MRRRVLLVVTAAAITYLYLWGFGYVVWIAAAQETPLWWGLLFATRRGASLSWLVLSHLVAISLLSIPFAWVLSRIYGRFGVWVSVGLAVFIWAILEAPLFLDAMRDHSVWMKGLWLFDSLQILAILPGLVWLLRMLPSNNRWRGP